MRRLLFALACVLPVVPFDLTARGDDVRTAASRGATSLEELDRLRLERYLATLRSGQPASARQVDELADVSFAGLRTILEEYAALDADTPPQAHRAFQALIERTSRSALAPWPLVTFYSSDFADFLTRPIHANPLSQRVFSRLIDSVDDPRAFDLAVRLAPQAALRHLAAGERRGQVELLEAWNRRLSRGPEQRPIPDRDALVRRIAASRSIDAAAREREAHLRFLAGWSIVRGEYESRLAECLESGDPAAVRGGLAVQRHAPALLDRNAALIERFAADAAIVEDVVASFGYDERRDHSAALRALWPRLGDGPTKARHNALVAMGVHFRGNDRLAADAAVAHPFELLDAALPALERGSPDEARRVVASVLSKGTRGREEALRLARTCRLRGFEPQAALLARDAAVDQIVRVRALLYLQLADGATRRGLVDLLRDPIGDVRLAAIQMMSPRDGLSDADLDAIAPRLIEAALEDRSLGHRQEALHALSQWRHPQAAEVFEKALADNPLPGIADGLLDPEGYWPYRMRLVALLGLATLGRVEARRELVELHARGGETERMDVLLCFLEIGEVPERAFDDLDSGEPKLVATAVELIRRHGNDEEKARLAGFVRRRPLWAAFRDSGLDDHGILERAGIRPTVPEGQK